ncbi:MAG: hypothetical protein HQK73_04030 [Desulfamplus sp.]|nr:hypothetical protein [Desulfamplus sp.]
MIKIKTASIVKKVSTKMCLLNLLIASSLSLILTAAMLTSCTGLNKNNEITDKNAVQSSYMVSDANYNNSAPAEHGTSPPP